MCTLSYIITLYLSLCQKVNVLTSELVFLSKPVSMVMVYCVCISVLSSIRIVNTRRLVVKDIGSR